MKGRTALVLWTLAILTIFTMPQAKSALSVIRTSERFGTLDIKNDEKSLSELIKKLPRQELLRIFFQWKELIKKSKMKNTRLQQSEEYLIIRKI